MKKVKITFTFRDYETYYQIDGGEALAELEQVVRELNEEIEPKLQEDGRTLTEEYKKAITKDIFELYTGFNATNEVEYKGKKIVRVIDKDVYEDSDRVSINQFNKLNEAIAWVTSTFLPVYKDSFENVEYEKLPPNTVIYNELRNKLDFPAVETVSTLLIGIKAQVLKK